MELTTTSKEPSMQPFTPITAEELAFQPAEWADEGQKITEAVARGYRVVIEEAEDGRSFKWTVMATSEVSESPELIADSSNYSHINRGARQAIRMALVMLNKHLRESEKAARKAEHEAKAKKPTPTKRPKRQKATAAA